MREYRARHMPQSQGRQAAASAAQAQNVPLALKQLYEQASKYGLNLTERQEPSTTSSFPSVEEEYLSWTQTKPKDCDDLVAYWQVSISL